MIEVIGFEFDTKAVDRIYNFVDSCQFEAVTSKTTLYIIIISYAKRIRQTVNYDYNEEIRS